jgi:hypothetical protein
MPIPRIEIYLNENSELTIANFREQDRGPLLVDIKLGDLIADGFDTATSRFGEPLLRTLMLWHRAAFDQYGGFKSVKKTVLSDFELADLLIAKSMTSKTRVHVKSIEQLLHHPETDVQECLKFVATLWPTIRAQLMKYPG